LRSIIGVFAGQSEVSDCGISGHIIHPGTTTLHHR